MEGSSYQEYSQTTHSTTLAFLSNIIHQKSIDMAQNIINNVQYIHMQNPGAQQAPQGLTYQLVPNSLPWDISAKRKNPEAGKRKINTQKAFLGITDDDASEALYAHWREIVKDQMIARNYADIY